MAEAVQLELVSGRYVVCRLAPDAALPDDGRDTALYAAVRTEDELSVVCAAQRAPAGVPGEGPFAALRVRGTLDFALVGVLASLTRPLADAGVSVFAISTYDTDYLLVRAEELERAVGALREAGFVVSAGAGG